MAEKIKKIGFFGGSFDPIHFGHLNLAIALKEKALLDEILFCPCFCSPFKAKTPPIATPIQRAEMLSLLIEEVPFFRMTSMEVEKKGSSFTIDTLRSLQAPYVEYRLILSTESAAHFHAWKEAGELLRLAPPLIGLREGSFVSDSPLKSILEKNVLKTPLFDVASTTIRERIKKNLYCGHLVPQKVLDYIQTHSLYS